LSLYKYEIKINVSRGGGGYGGDGVITIFWLHCSGPGGNRRHHNSSAIDWIYWKRHATRSVFQWRNILWKVCSVSYCP